MVCTVCGYVGCFTGEFLPDPSTHGVRSRLKHLGLGLTLCGPSWDASLVSSSPSSHSSFLDRNTRVNRGRFYLNALLGSYKSCGPASCTEVAALFSTGREILASATHHRNTNIPGGTTNWLHSLETLVKVCPVLFHLLLQLILLILDIFHFFVPYPLILFLFILLILHLFPISLASFSITTSSCTFSCCSTIVLPAQFVGKNIPSS